MATTFNLYDILGVERDASEDDIRAAFRKLTFKHHPDRYSGDKRERAELRFQEITEAFNVLSRPKSRKKYDQELTAGQAPASMDRSEIARKLAAKGAQTLKEGRVSDALRELKSALDHDDNCSRAHYFMGMALGKFNGREKDALRHLERAAVLDPGKAVILGEAATMALNVGMKARAQRLAEEALKFDPTSARASNVMQLLGSSDQSQGREGGLFSRLRRKG